MRDSSSKKPTVQLLLISDNPKDVLTFRMMAAEVKTAAYEWVIAKSLKEGILQLSKNQFGLVFLDLTIRGNKGLSTLLELEKQNLSIPVVILTASENQSLALEAVKCGAQDYLIKGRLDPNVLARVVHYTMERHRVMTEMKEKNRELERLNALKSEFVSTVSHELRTPLTVILSSSENMLDGAIGELSDDQRKWIKKINGHALRLHDMINDILDLSKLQSGKAEIHLADIDPLAFVHQTMDGLGLLVQGKNHRLALDLPVSMDLIWADRGRLEQVLTNLVANAVKYTPAGGEVRIAVRNDNGTVVFSVSDSGPGIAHEHLEMIFERFRQIRQKDDPEKATQGIGLGLAICKEIVQQHGGRIWVESKMGQGSRFSFSIPKKPAVARAKAA